MRFLSGRGAIFRRSRIDRRFIIRTFYFFSIDEGHLEESNLIPGWERHLIFYNYSLNVNWHLITPHNWTYGGGLEGSRNKSKIGSQSEQSLSPYIML